MSVRRLDRPGHGRRIAPADGARATGGARVPRIAATVRVAPRVRAAAVTWGIWLATACVGRAGRVTVEPPRTLAPGNEAVALYGELLAAADARRADTALFRRALRSESPAIRIEAVRAAGQVGARDWAPAIRALLAGGDTAVAATAAQALGLLIDTASVPALGRALRGAPSAAREAAWSLGAIGEPARAVIEPALRQGVPDEGAMAALLTASARLTPVPAAAVVAYLGPADRGPEVVRAAAYALSRRPVPAGVRALLDVAHAADPDVRRLAAIGLGRSAAGDSLAAPARNTLDALLADTDRYVRTAAVRSLVTFGDSARGAIVRALHDPDANVRIAAAGVLDRVLGGRRGDWARAFEADTSLAYREAVVAAAIRSGVELQAIDHDNADRWQRQGDWRYRAAAAAAATDTPIERVVDLALPLTRDPDGRVRAVAYGVFAAWLDSTNASQHPWRRQYMREALADDDYIVRATALTSLTREATAADAGPALEAYRRARGDSGADARVAAIVLLDSAWSHDRPHIPDSVRAAVAALPAPTDPRERRAATGSLFGPWRTAGGRGGDLRPRAWYDSVVRAVVLPSLSGRPPQVRIQTGRGTLTVALDGAAAPLTVANFIALARAGYYRGTTFHRVVPGFVVQDGDPRGDGNGGPPDAVRDELNRRAYVRGTIGMALSGPDTGGGQYFLTLTRQPHLDGHYTAFGQLIDGYDVLECLVQNDPITGVEVP